jgi:DNA-binding LacI/PurR family transcriptional regulator
MASISDVAKEAGVSPAVVSAVLRGSSGTVRYSEKTAQAVRRACEKLHYTRNLAAAYLREQRSYSLAVLVFHLCDEYCATVVSGVESELATTPYSLLLADTRRDEEKVRQYMNLFRQKRVDGILIVGCSDATIQTVCTEARWNSIPTVIVGPDLGEAGVPSVSCDQTGGAYAATKHLIDLGHRRVAGIFDDIEIQDARQRVVGMAKACAESGLPFDEALIHHCLPSTDEYRMGYEAAHILLKESFTALFVGGGDKHAVGAVRALSEAGLRVPEDVSVVAFDNLSFAAYVQPPLTTVVQPMEEMGRQAAKVFLKTVSQDASLPADDNVRIVLGTRLVVRDSTQSI